MSKKLPDGWHPVPGDGIGDVYLRYRVNGWPDIDTRAEHVCYVKDNKVIACNGMSAHPRLGKSPPSVDEISYLARCEKKWGVKLDELLGLTDPPSKELGWGQVLGGTAATLLGLTILNGLRGRVKANTKNVKTIDNLITLDEPVEVEK